MYVFLDLETTGLDPNNDLILEVGVAVYDDELSLRAIWSDVIYCDKNTIKNLAPYVDRLHTKNGLWEACKNSTKSIDDIEINIIKFLNNFADPETEPLCGSTISFDRSFLKAQMPQLESWFHYRNVDVSSFGIVLEKLGIPRPPKKEAHRVVADCIESADNLRYYLDSWKSHHGK